MVESREKEEKEENHKNTELTQYFYCNRTLVAIRHTFEGLSTIIDDIYDSNLGIIVGCQNDLTVTIPSIFFKTVPLQ